MKPVLGEFETLLKFIKFGHRRYVKVVNGTLVTFPNSDSHSIFLKNVKYYRSKNLEANIFASCWLAWFPQKKISYFIQYFASINLTIIFIEY